MPWLSRTSNATTASQSGTDTPTLNPTPTLPGTDTTVIRIATPTFHATATPTFTTTTTSLRHSADCRQRYYAATLLGEHCADSLIVRLSGLRVLKWTLRIEMQRKQQPTTGAPKVLHMSPRNAPSSGG